MGAGAGVCGCVGQSGTSIEVCTGTFSLTQSEHRQTDRDTRRCVRCSFSGGFPSPGLATETPSALAPSHLSDTHDGSPSAERREGEGGGGKEGRGGKRIKRGRRTRVDQASRPASVSGRTQQTHQDHECSNLLLSRL